MLNYPFLRKNVDLELTPEKEKEVEAILIGSDRTIAQEKPHEAKWLNYCKSFSHRELCWGRSRNLSENFFMSDKRINPLIYAV